MPALKEIARKAASEIREGICWVVIYRVGRSWYSTTLHSDLWDNECGTNRLAEDDTLTRARAGMEEARRQAARAGLPFCQRLVDGPEDEFDPYLYDGSMTLEDYNAMREAGDAAASCIKAGEGVSPFFSGEQWPQVAQIRQVERREMKWQH